MKGKQIEGRRMTDKGMMGKGMMGKGMEDGEETRPSPIRLPSIRLPSIRLSPFLGNKGCSGFANSREARSGNRPHSDGVAGGQALANGWPSAAVTP